MNTIRDRRLFNTSSAVTTPYPTVYSSISGDTTVIIPAGYALEFMTFLNSTANNAIISCGTTASGIEIFTNQTVYGTGTDNGLTTFSIHLVSSLTSPTTLYVHDDAAGDSWNSANVTIYLVFRKLV